MVLIMKTDIQQTIIIGLIILGLALIIKDQFTLVDGIAIGLIGFLSQRTQTEKQEEEYNRLVMEADEQ